MDLYDFSETTGADPLTAASSGSNATGVPQQTLEQEVNQVFGQLGRFWGGFRKQSATVFESAKKDLGEAVNQAREQVGKLATTETEEPAPSSAAEASGQPSSPIPSSDKGTQPETPPRTKQEDTANNTTPTMPSSSSFFSRLQSSLPPQLAPESISHTFQSLQKQIQPTVASASTAASQAAAQASQAASQVDIQGIRTSLNSNLQRLQSNPLLQEAEKLADEYRLKSEALLNQAGEYLKDAVKVIPPEGDEHHPNVAWDGSDVWMFPSPIGTAGWGGAGDAKARRSSGEAMTSTARMTRSEAVLARLRRDPEMLKLDPNDDAVVKERYQQYVQEDITAHGGLEGELWSGRIHAASDEKDPEGVALAATRYKLVPSSLSSDEFWHRYFFRVQQIQEEEEKRKSLLEATNQTDEDFSWEDDDEESVSSPKPHSAKLPLQAAAIVETPPAHDVSVTPKDGTSTSTTAKSTPVIEQSAAMVSTTTLTPPKDAHHARDGTESGGPPSTVASPRESEESYDLVSTGVHSKDASSDDSDWE